MTNNIEDIKNIGLEREKYNLDVEDAKEIAEIIDDVSDKIDVVVSDSFVKNMTYRVLDKLDEEYMDSVRELWEKTPESVKWAIAYLPTILSTNTAFLPLMPFRLMVKSGLLEYPENKLQDASKVEEEMIEFLDKYLVLIDQRLAVVKPFLVPLQKIIDKQEEYFADLREHLRNKRAGENYKKAS